MSDLVKKNRIVIGLIVSIFICYNVIIYTRKSEGPEILLSEKALTGEKLWQDNNCTACHQLYGLGGYLGPDLTNITSNPSKGREYVKIFLNSGVKSMPKFSFTDEEKEAIISFLEHVDSTGYYPSISSEFNSDGWVAIEYK